MIRLESILKFSIHRRPRWVVLTIGRDRFLLDPAEAVKLSNGLIDAAEEEAG